MMSEASTTDYEIAVERVVGFLQQFDRAHFDLACHAAFPLVITPDLLYQIWLHFVPQAPWIAVARVLLSRLCREVGYELYEMDIAVRNLLLAELKDNEEFNKDKPRLEKLADFLTSYVTQQFTGDNSHAKNLAQGQYWTALAYTKPDKLSRELLEAIEQRLQDKNWKELFRLSSLVETFAKPLAEFAPLLITYARGMASFTIGDKEGATEQFSQLPRRDRLVNIDGVSLSIPDEVHLTTVDRDFLRELLKVILDSNGDPQIVYPILRENLDKLDDSFAALLGSWAATILPNVELEKAQGITVTITTLSNLLTEFPLGNRANNVEIAITGYEIALSLFTRDNFPEQWAMIQNYLAVAYIQRIRGDNAENLERAISCFKAALQVRTREAFPTQWAMTQNNLGRAYSQRIRGERAENLKQAISCFEAALQVYPREAFPVDWANTQNNLGIAYRERIRGDRAENLERAISHFMNALQVYTREAFLQQWAETQKNLAVAYIERIKGDQAENLEQAIGCLQNAVQVYTCEIFPYTWAETQSNLAVAYRQRIRGEQLENLELAIYCYQNALQVYTIEAFPIEWAETQNNLGIAYRERIRGERAENLEQAINCFMNALQVYTRSSFPQQWANTQNNLGVAYRARIRGERAENLEQAINCFMKVLQVYTHEAFPHDWAETQNNLGITYLERIEGDHADNLERAIYCFQNALQIYTRASFPQNHLETLFNLALAYQNTHQLTSAYNTFVNAVDTLELFRNRAFDRLNIKEEKQEFSEQLNKLYQHMAEVCLKLDNATEAIEYVERSKTRNLVELILTRDRHTIFPTEVVTQLDGLRDEIASGQYQLQNATAEDPTALTQHLQQLRQQRNELQDRYLPIGSGFQFDPFRLALSDRTAIIEFYITNDKLLVFIITNQTQQPIVLSPDLINPNKLANWANSYLKAYSHKKSHWQRRLTTRLHLLAKILHIDEIIKQIPTECDQLVLIPNRFLHCIPLHALPLADGSCLLDRFPGGVRYVPSCQLLQLVQTRQRPEFSHFFAIQNPNGDLTYTDIEVETIKQYFPDADVLAKAAATKEALNNPTLQSIHCLHFSGHSDFNIYSPLQSRLYFADEPVTLAEIFTLDLSQCRLVTLSASETALTDWTSASDEYIGFPSAFLFAGSNSVVGSLWAPNDLSTALLMIKFYQNLQTGSTVAVALNQAQLWLRNITRLEVEQWITENLSQLNPTLRMNLRRQLHRLPDYAQPFGKPFHWAAFCAIGQ